MLPPISTFKPTSVPRFGTITAGETSVDGFAACLKLYCDDGEFDSFVKDQPHLYADRLALGTTYHPLKEEAGSDIWLYFYSKDRSQDGETLDAADFVEQLLYQITKCPDKIIHFFRDALASHRKFTPPVKTRDSQTPLSAGDVLLLDIEPDFVDRIILHLQTAENGFLPFLSDNSDFRTDLIHIDTDYHPLNDNYPDNNHGLPVFRLIAEKLNTEDGDEDERFQDVLVPPNFDEIIQRIVNLHEKPRAFLSEALKASRLTNFFARFPSR